VSQKDPTPFDFIAAVGQTKVDMLANDPSMEKAYTPYVINRGFSYFIDTILHANEMNIKNNLDNGPQFYYYMGSLPSKKRFSKWHKAEKSESLDLIQEHYGVRREIAKQYLKILGESDLENIREIHDQGGTSKTK